MGSFEQTMKANIYKFLGLILSTYLLYTAGFGSFSLPIHRGIPLMIVAIMVFLKYPMFKKGSSLRRFRYFPIFEKVANILLIPGFMLTTYYTIAYAEEIALSLGSTTTVDVFISVIGILTVFEITRRTAPPALFYLGLASVAYALLGQYLPGDFGHVGFKLSSILQYLYFS